MEQSLGAVVFRREPYLRGASCTYELKDATSLAAELEMDAAILPLFVAQSCPSAFLSPEAKKKIASAGGNDAVSVLLSDIRQKARHLTVKYAAVTKSQPGQYLC